MKGKGALGEPVWFHMEDKEESKKHCLVGQWGKSSFLVPELQAL